MESRDWSPAMLPGVATRLMQARSNGGTYRIWLWQPPDPPSSGLPVLYVLDAGSVFAGFVETARRAGNRPDSSGIGPVVLVGIAPEGADEPQRRAARQRDYTAGPAADASLLADASPPAGGGAAAFLAFLERELVPAVENGLPVDPARRGLFGHSLAGYFCLWVLATRPELFRDYLAVSPSIWWDAGALQPDASRLAAAPHPPRAWLAAGEWEGTPAPWQHRLAADPARRELRERRGMIGNAGLHARRLAAALPGQSARFELLAGEDHGSVVLPSIGRALRFMHGADTADRIS